MRADGRDQPRGEIAPVAEVCRKGGPDFASAELEQSMTRASSECAFQPPCERGRQLEGIIRDGEQQVAARGQGERWHDPYYHEVAPENGPTGIRHVRLER